MEHNEELHRKGAFEDTSAGKNPACLEIRDEALVIDLLSFRSISMSRSQCCNACPRIWNTTSCWIRRLNARILWSRCVMSLPSQSHPTPPPSIAQENPSTLCWGKHLSSIGWKSAATALCVNRYFSVFLWYPDHPYTREFDVPMVITSLSRLYPSLRLATIHLPRPTMLSLWRAGRSDRKSP